METPSASNNPGESPPEHRSSANLDLIFGTYYLPGRQWPTGYGIHDKVPGGWLRQFFYPFLPGRKSVQEDTPTVEVHE